MEQIVVKRMSSYEHKNEACEFPKIMIRPKSHRKLLSGLKLFKSIKPNSTNTGFGSILKRGNEEENHDEEVIKKQYLPHHLITQLILTRLSTRILLQLKSVSKEWYSSISSYEFAKMHLKVCLFTHHPTSPIECLFIQAENNYYLLYYKEEEEILDYYFVKLETNFDEKDKEELHLVGSCNGLVCLAKSSPTAGYFYLWNPITQDYRNFFDPCSLSYNHRTSWGFGYLSCLDDYKVVRLVQNRNTLEMVAHVFSLQTGNWKQVTDHGFHQNVSLTKINPGVLVDETLYWFLDTSAPNMNLTVAGFNLATEKFDKRPDLIPKSISPWNQFICVMGGCLCICGLNMNEEIHITMLKKSGEVESIHVSSDFCLRLCYALEGFTRHGRFFVISKNSELALIDSTVSPKQYTPLITFKKGPGPGMVSFVPSLISPFRVSELQKS